MVYAKLQYNAIHRCLLSILDCTAGRCDEKLGYCIIGHYDETKPCGDEEKEMFYMKEKGTPSNIIQPQYLIVFRYLKL